MTCDFHNKDGIRCTNDEAYSTDVYCHSGECSLIIYKCKTHEKEEISFDRMLEIIRENPEYGEDAFEKLNCHCIVETQSIKQ